MDEEQVELERRLAETRKIRWSAQEKDKVTSKRQNIIESSRREAMDLKRNLRIEAESIIRDLKQQSSENTDQNGEKPLKKPAVRFSRFRCRIRKNGGVILLLYLNWKQDRLFLLIP